MKHHRPLGEHNVVKQWNQYIKTPKNPAFFLGTKDSLLATAYIEESIQYITTHFSDWLHIPETKIIQHTDTTYQIIQEEVKGKSLDLRKIKDDEKLLDSLQKLRKHNRDLRHSHWKAIDLYGTDVLLKPYIMHNIIHGDDGKLYIIDLWLLKKDVPHSLYGNVCHIAFYSQYALLKASWNYMKRPNYEDVYKSY